ncbi:MAG: Eco47II family restriction endonuclease [Bacteroidaceae bacterium]|nr:Eco47II family restriction endonuclease [Bacteroidaceae bacterium]
MRNYNLGFISDENIYNHVRETVNRYSASIDLKEFNKNIIDPIKLTFDAKVYGRTMEEVVASECMRQMDKSNNNHIGYFHQNLFRYAGNGWSVPTEGFDVVNEEQHIFVEMKNKHNTMNSAASQKTYMKMQNKIVRDSRATCMLVEAIATKSQNKTWIVTVDKEQFNNEHIRRVSMDKFYEIVFGDAQAFARLCRTLPDILDDVIVEMSREENQNTVFAELAAISPNIMKSLYLLAFRTYDGFDNF